MDGPADCVQYMIVVKITTLWSFLQCLHALNLGIFRSAPNLQIQTTSIAKLGYKQRCCEVEQACSTPLVMALTGGLAIVATTSYKRLASLLGRNMASLVATPLTQVQTRHSYTPPYNASEVFASL